MMINKKQRSVKRQKIKLMILKIRLMIQQQPMTWHFQSMRSKINKLTWSLSWLPWSLARRYYKAILVMMNKRRLVEEIDRYVGSHQN
jgi:hypothetical protein